MNSYTWVMGPLLALLGFAVMWGAYGQRIKDLEDANERIEKDLESTRKALAEKLDKDALNNALTAINTRFDDLRELISVALGTKDRRSV